MIRRLLGVLPVVLLACSGDGDDPSRDGTSVRNGASSNDPSSSSGSPSSASPIATDDASAPGEGRAYVPFDINHVLSTGQSNSTANDATTILSKTQPYTNLMFDSGVMTGGDCDGNGCLTYQKPSALVPLVEGDSFFYPVETMSSGLANEATKLARERYGQATHDVLVSVHARSGNGYICLRKGGCDWWKDQSYVRPFDEAMMQVADALALAKAAGKTYAVRAVTAVHGENDHHTLESPDSYYPLSRTDGSGGMIADYADALEEWQRDYESSVKAITGQTVPVPLLISQYSHWNDGPHTQISFMQLAAHVRSKGKVVIVGPTYALPYGTDCSHFKSDGERWLGEYFAKAYSQMIIDGRDWEPLRPLQAVRAGNVITVKYHVPVPPLVIDTQRVSEAANYGFEIADDSAAPPAIAKVEIAGADTVKITLGSEPTGNARLRYAYTFDGCLNGRTSARGNVRDSDATPSQAGYELYNWSVHFDLPL